MANLEVRILENLESDSELFLNWESLVQTDASSGFMQSLDWAEFKRRQGLRSFHLGLFADETLVGGALLYGVAESCGAGIYVAPEGPVLPWHDQQLAASGMKLIMQTIQSKAKELGIMAVRIIPKVPMPIPRCLRGFGKAPVDLLERETLYLDVSQSESQLLATMKPKGRYNIGLSERHGVTIDISQEPVAVRDFYPIFKEASTRDDFRIEPLNFFIDLADTLCPKGIAHFLFAKHQGETLATMLLVTYGDRATYLYGGISNRKRNLMAGYALQWAAIKHAQALGCTTYDFYGFDQHCAPSSAYAQFSRFKSNFGGQVKRFIGAHDFYFVDNLADAIIRAANEINFAECSQDVQAGAR